MTSKPSNRYPVDWFSVVVYVGSHLLFAYGILFHALTRETLVLALLFYWLTAFSVSAGYHRLWSHTSYVASAPLSLFMLLLGAGSFLGPVITWVRYHRAHHRFIDTNKDPTNIKNGWMYAHIGWRLIRFPFAPEVSIEDLEKNRLVRWQQSNYFWIAPFFGLLLPITIANLWGDPLGGFLFAALGRILVFQHAHFSTQSTAHLIGFQHYSNQNSARNLFTVSFFTFGEGYRNFHHEFPTDYRLGSRVWDLDATKWILWTLSMVGLAFNLNETKQVEILKTRIDMKQKKLDVLKTQVDFGPEESQLPIETWASIENRTASGDKLVVVDGIVHDVSKFIKDHPGGIKILESKLGRDATLAFNGSVYRHTKAARNLAATMRVSRLPKDEILLKVASDSVNDPSTSVQ